MLAKEIESWFSLSPNCNLSAILPHFTNLKFLITKKVINPVLDSLHFRELLPRPHRAPKRCLDMGVLTKFSKKRNNGDL